MGRVLTPEIRSGLIRKLIQSACVLTFVGCSGLGYQGGVIPSSFKGVISVQAISPQSVQLNWDAFPGTSQYNIYSADQNDPIYKPGFSSLIFKPIPQDPTRTYNYSVTAMDPITGTEQGLRSNYSPVKLLPHLDYVNTGAAITINKSSIRVTWQAYPTVTYMVFVAERLATGSVNYNSFISPRTTVISNGTATITGLAEGREYCTIVAAAYTDATNDTPNGVLFAGDIGSTLNSAAYMKGPSGSFGDSVIAKSQKCARTSSTFTVANINVYAPKASLSSQPTFYVSVPGDTIEDSSGPVSTDIYSYDTVTLLSAQVGSRIGTGKITTVSPLASGRYKFFAVISDLQGTGAQLKQEIIVGPAGSIPSDEKSRQWVYIRAFNTSEDPTNPAGYFPDKQQGGLGSQRAGAAVAVGDFNCDGKYDLAVGISDAAVMSTVDNRPATQGRVVVYYDINNGTPNITPRIQVISFDITSFAGDPGRNLRLGVTLRAGNFNGDNQVTNQYGAGLVSAFHCDDLVMGSGYGPMFVLYGKRDVGTISYTPPPTAANPNPTATPIPDGGLNYDKPTSYTINPSASCDPSTNVCQPAMYAGSSYTIAIGSVPFNPQSPNTIYGATLTSGDYNGDGFEDLAALSSTGGIWAFRGSEFGLISPNSYAFAADVINTTPGPYLGFPYLQASNSNAWAPNPTPAPGWGASNAVLSTFHNAYYDYNYGGAYGTKRVRDILMVAYSGYNSNTGRVIACIPRTDPLLTHPTWASDANTSLFWDCSSFIDPPASVSNFGFAMVDVKNALRYRPDQFRDISTQCYLPNTNTIAPEDFPNCQDPTTVLAGYSPVRMGYPGAIAVSGNFNPGAGSPAVASVFLYYGVNVPTPYALTVAPATDRDVLGAQKNTYFSNLFKGKRYNGVTALNLVTTPSCVINAGSEYCDIQKINHPTTGSGGFGQVLAAIPGSVVNDTAGTSKDTILAVAAPSRTITVSGGTSYANTGTVQLFMQNSYFASNPIVIRASVAPGPPYDPCAPDGICRYSDGFSTSLTTAIDYDGNNNAGIYFGKGGIAGGPIEPAPGSNPTTYNPNSDIFIGAPGNIAQVTVGSNTVNVIDNGSVFSYFSHGGTYRTFRVSETGPSPSTWHSVDRSFGQESDVKFHQAFPIGDLNLDGSDDVAVRINQGTKNSVRLYTSYSSKIGFQTSAGSYTNFQVQGDTSAGQRFVPAGMITNGAYPAYFVTGSTASYLYFSSVGGIIPGVPTPFGVGGIPRKLYAPSGTRFDTPFGGYIGYLDFADSNFYNAESVGNIDTTLNTYTPFAHGDFNGDGYEDFAFAIDTALWGGPSAYTPGSGIADTTKSHTALCPSNLCINGTNPVTNGNGRVFVFYGGVDNGFQVQPDTNGGLPMDDAHFTDYSSTAATKSILGAPCTTVPSGAGYSVSCPKAQILWEGNTTSFGSTMTAVPLGSCIFNGNQVPVSGLMVTAHNGNTTKVYLYKPNCLLNGQANNYNGLTSVTIDSTVTLPVSTQNSGTGGIGMTAVAAGLTNSPGFMGSFTPSGIIAHAVIADETSRNIVVVPIHTIDGTNSNLGLYTDNVNGGRLVDYSVSTYIAGATGNSIGFGSGVSGVGDINGDGFSDVAINFARINRKDVASQTSTQGGVLVLFGGATGLQTHSNVANTTIIEPSRTSTCYTQPGVTAITSICNPTILYLPQPTNSLRNGAYERTFLSPFAAAHTSSSANESLGTFLMGIPGRDSLDTNPANRTLQGGAFYVLP